MAADYEKFYSQNRHGLGEPTKEFVTFFDGFERSESSVLDVGCGQGRDALFIARLGHYVTAIDLSPSGIRDLRNDADAEGLSIHAEIVDIRHYQSNSRFDVIVVDRTLHMLAEDDRLQVLRALLGLTSKGSNILIADERSNIPAFKRVFEKSKRIWSPSLERRGYLFVRRD
jgi:tellurite methyltransferase